MIHTTKPEKERTSNDNAAQACVRCGVIRRVRSGRANQTCRDCRDSMSPAERLIWAA